MKTKALAGIALLVCAAGVCQAKTEYRLASGDCDGSTVGWWSTSRYDNGRLVETWGMDCNGKEYHTFGRTVTITGPLAGTATDAGSCDAAPGSSWYAVVTRNESGAPIAAWGRDCAGHYWQAVIAPASASQGVIPGTMQPVTGERGIR